MANKQHRPHGSGIRGLTQVDLSSSLGGRFGRLFDPVSAPPADFSDGALWSLAQAMKGDGEVKDGADAEESEIPSAFTYLGQFIDHDLTFDPSTFSQQRSDPNGIEDFRTPRFDLDNLYGRGPSDQPYLYEGRKLLLGGPLSGAQRNPNARDLARAATAGPARAIVGDPRNDENVIVSQLHGLFLRFHNQIADHNPSWAFELVQREVRWHYQWIVLHDFLPRIVDHAVLDSVSPGFVDPTHRLTQPRHTIYDYASRYAIIPVEFSVAAYRLGHSMVRPGYRVNEATPPLPIFNRENPAAGLNAFGRFNSNWAIDWQRFIDLGQGGANTDQDRVQMAYRLDTSLVEPLANLPQSVAGAEGDADPKLLSLAFRNLVRGKKLLLPTGQSVARLLGHAPLSDEHILIGAAEDGSAETADGTPISQLSMEFRGATPLWVYALAEARHNFYAQGKGVLGRVGGRIVAETFLALLLRDPSSFLNERPSWQPSSPGFGLKDLILRALEA
jgi:hypothetical protein